MMQIPPVITAKAPQARGSEVPPLRFGRGVNLYTPVQKAVATQMTKVAVDDAGTQHTYGDLLRRFQKESQRAKQLLWPGNWFSLASKRWVFSGSVMPPFHKPESKIAYYQALFSLEANGYLTSMSTWAGYPLAEPHGQGPYVDEYRLTDLGLTALSLVNHQDSSQ